MDRAGQSESPSEASATPRNLNDAASHGAGAGKTNEGSGVMGAGASSDLVTHLAAVAHESGLNDGLVNNVMRPDGTGTGLATDMTDDLIYFDPVQKFFQDMDFTLWDLNFDALPVPQFDCHGPSPGSTATSTSKRSRTAVRDLSRGHSAFKRSLWLWEPDSMDRGGQYRDGMNVNVDEGTQQLLQCNSEPSSLLASSAAVRTLRMSPATRDRLFAMVLSVQKDPTRLPSFPSLELLNYLMQAHFMHDEYQPDACIHAATFDPDKAVPELLAAVIANGSMLVAMPPIGQFGLALQEVVRQRMSVVVSMCERERERSTPSKQASCSSR